MWSEAYINALGLTTGNYVTYSRVLESVGDVKPLVKEYRYTNHNNCPDTADFKMYTNIDNVSLDNKFTSRALMRGSLRTKYGTVTARRSRKYGIATTATRPGSETMPGVLNNSRFRAFPAI